MQVGPTLNLQHSFFQQCFGHCEQGWEGFPELCLHSGGAQDSGLGRFGRECTEASVNLQREALEIVQHLCIPSSDPAALSLEL